MLSRTKIYASGLNYLAKRQFRTVLRANSTCKSCFQVKATVASPFMHQKRAFSSDEETPEETEEANQDESVREDTSAQSNLILEGLGQNIMGNLRRPKGKDKKDASKDRRVPVSWETSARYMNSEAYKTTYGDLNVWQPYRRNFKGQFFVLPLLTRLTCVGEDGFLNTGNPCPICRDEYLIIDYRNVKLLQQFIDPFTAQIYEPRKSSLCMVKHEELLVAIFKAKDYGTFSFHIPFRAFDYRDYYLPEQISHLNLAPPIKITDDPDVRKVLAQDEHGSHHEFAIENFK